MTTASSGDGVHMQRKAAAGKVFGVVEVVDNAHFSESYNNIAQDYTRHCVSWVEVTVEPTDWIEAHASGQVDQKGTTIMEVVQKLEVLYAGVWHEMSEETGVNIGARTSANIAAHLDRHHEDFSAHGVFDIRALNLPGARRVLVCWCFRARDSNMPAVIPQDSTRVIVKVYREFAVAAA